MDLLAGYDSDASGASGSPEAPADAETVQVKPSLPSWASNSQAAQGAGLLNKLPAPTGQPALKKRRTLPMTLQHVPDSDEEVRLTAASCLNGTDVNRGKSAPAGSAKETGAGEQQGQKLGGLSACPKARPGFSSS